MFCFLSIKNFKLSKTIFFGQNIFSLFSAINKIKGFHSGCGILRFIGLSSGYRRRRHDYGSGKLAPKNSTEMVEISILTGAGSGAPDNLF